jgi:hypothetical protein
MFGLKQEAQAFSTTAKLAVKLSSTARKSALFPGAEETADEVWFRSQVEPNCRRLAEAEKQVP